MGSAYVIVFIEVPVYMEFVFRSPMLATEVFCSSRVCEKLSDRLYIRI